MTRAAIYARVSTLDQAAGSSLQGQIEELRRFAGYKRFDVDEGLIFLEEGISGARERRPAFDAMLAAAKDRRFDALLCWSVSRFGRNARAALNSLHELEQAGIEAVYFLKENLDTSTTVNRAILLPLLSGIAEMERETIAAQAKLGQRASARANKWNGGVPSFGYRAVQADSGKGKTLALADKPWELIGRSEVEIVRRIFSLAAQGKTPTAICRDLHSIGVPPPSAWPGRQRKGIAPAVVWDHSVVSRIIKDPTYWGRSSYAKTMLKPPSPELQAQRRRLGTGKQEAVKVAQPASEHVEISVPPIVSIQLWQSAQGVVGTQARNAGRRHSYMLSHRITCSECGARYVASVRGNAGRMYFCGRMHWRLRADRCTNRRQLKADVIEDQIWQLVTKLLTDRRWVEQALKARARSAPTAESTSLDRLRRELKAKRTEGDRLLRLYTKGDLDEARYARAMKDIRFEERAFEQQLAELEKQRGSALNAAAAMASLERVAKRLKRRLSATSIDEKAEVFATLNGRLVAHPDRTKVKVSIPIADVAAGSGLVLQVPPVGIEPTLRPF